MREQLVPSAANAYVEQEMINEYLDKDNRKALVIRAITIELETDIEYVASDEFFIQITTQEFGAEAFLDDKDVKFKRKHRFLITTEGMVEHQGIMSFPMGNSVIIPTSKFWIGFQTVGQSAAITVNIVLDCVMGFINEITWNRITAPD